MNLKQNTAYTFARYMNTVLGGHYFQFSPFMIFYYKNTPVVIYPLKQRNPLINCMLFPSRVKN